MRHFLASVLALGLSTGLAWAETVEDVIGQQLQAFNDRDVSTAFGFASPMIKRLFGNANNFGSMVARGYPMVWDNSEVRFLASRAENGAQYQRVMMRDAPGNLHVLEYKMIPLNDGWQIDGVQLLPAPDVGA